MRPSFLFRPALAGFAFLVCLHRVASFDYWTHLALGRYLWTARSLVIGEPFLLSGLQPATPPSWPFQVVIYGLQRVGGHAAACVAAALAAAVAFSLLWSLVPRSAGVGRKAVAWALLAVIAFVARGRFVPRPEILSYVFAAGALLLAHRWRRAPTTPAIVGLATLFGAWSLVHTGWAVGAALVLPAAALSPHWGYWRDLWRDARGRALSIGLGAAGLAAGAGAVLFATRVLGTRGQGSVLSMISEMQPLWTYPELLGPFAAASAMGFALAWGGREGRPGRLALCTLAVAAGAAAARNVALGLLALTLPALEGLSSLPVRRRPRALDVLCRLTPLAALPLLLLAVADRDPPWGIGVEWRLFPRDAAAFAKASSLPTPILNGFDIGGYLNWAWAGSPRTFVDGRAMAGDPGLLLWQQAAEAEVPGPLLATHGVRSVVTRALYYDSGRILPLVPGLLNDPAWGLVRATDALVFVRRPLPAGLPELPRNDAWAYVLRETEWKGAEGAGLPHLAYNRGVAAYERGDYPGAAAAFRVAVERHPAYAAAYSLYLYGAGLPIPP